MPKKDYRLTQISRYVAGMATVALYASFLALIAVVISFLAMRWF